MTRQQIITSGKRRALLLRTFGPHENQDRSIQCRNGYRSETSGSTCTPFGRLSGEKDFLAVFVPGSATPRRFEGQVAQKIWDYAQGEVWEESKQKKSSRPG